MSFETEFLPHTAIPGTGRTVAEQIGPELDVAIESGQTPRLQISAG